MPGLDVSQVSSNWKKLQETLQAGKKADAKGNGLKRKRPLANGKPAKAFKKARLDDSSLQNSGKKANMGQNGTKESASHQVLAQDHGIAKEDISAAYDTANGSTTVHKDEVNGGLHPTHKAGKFVALDCEMVGSGPPPHHDHVLARVSMVNFHGEQLYDSFVLPPKGIKVEDYRTHVSGIKPEHLRPGYARTFAEVQKDVSNLLDGRILIGHALRNDLQVLMLSHPQRDIRDTFRYPKFREENFGRPPSLRNLAVKELGMKIQMGEHSSIEDARATMMIFRKEKAGFEEDHRKRYGASANGVPRGTKQKPSAAASDAGRDEDEDEDEDDEADLELLDGEESSGIPDDGSLTLPKTKTGPKKKGKKKKRTKRNRLQEDGLITVFVGSRADSDVFKLQNAVILGLSTTDAFDELLQDEEYYKETTNSLALPDDDDATAWEMMLHCKFGGETLFKEDCDGAFATAILPGCSSARSTSSLTSRLQHLIFALKVHNPATEVFKTVFSSTEPASKLYELMARKRLTSYAGTRTNRSFRRLRGVKGPPSLYPITLEARVAALDSFIR